METSGNSGIKWGTIIGGLLLLIAIFAGGFFLLRRNTLTDDNNSNGNGTEPTEPTDAQLEEKFRLKFMADCKSAGLSEVFCAQAWNNSDKETTFSQFADTGYGIPGGGCVPFTKQQHNAAVNACWKKCLYLGFIPGGFLQAQCFEKCKKTIPPIISCP